MGVRLNEELDGAEVNKGLVYVFTGDGKGKTSAALGVTMRAVSNGMRVAWVSWYKQDSWRISELKLPELLKTDLLEIFLMGEGFRIQGVSKKVGTDIKTASVGGEGQKVVDDASEKEHKQAALNALRKAENLIKRVDVLVLDEVNNAVNDELVELDKLLNLIDGREKTHLVLTGRNAAKDIIEEADLVTEMKKVKHPYDAGKLAVKGLDY